jgi:hypothetical protein
MKYEWMNEWTLHYPIYLCVKHVFNAWYLCAKHTNWWMNELCTISNTKSLDVNFVMNGTYYCMNVGWY